jgi:entericidin B
MRTLIASLMLGVMFLAGCNTMQGVGRDIERGGEKLQGAAEDAKKK